MIVFVGQNNFFALQVWVLRGSRATGQTETTPQECCMIQHQAQPYSLHRQQCGASNGRHGALAQLAQLLESSVTVTARSTPAGGAASWCYLEDAKILEYYLYPC